MMRFFAILVLALSLLPLGSAAASDATESSPRAPRSQPAQALNFAMLDYRGKYYELHRAEAKAVVLFFTGNGCPIARQSISKIRALRSKFAKDGAVFWMVNANPQDDRESIAEEANEFKVGSIPILKDDTQGIARSFSVKRTCEAIAISTKDWTVFYHGAIDDQLTEGAKKPQPTEKYLETALGEFFAGSPITKPKSAVAGCLIKYDADAMEVSYAKQVAPLLREKCVSCHSPGNIGPFAMSSHKKVKGWSEMIQEVILTKRMPPWHADPHFGKFANDRSLTTDEAKLLLRWIEQDCPRGEGEDSLVAASAPDPTWPLGKPDYVVTLPAEQTIPATGVLSYRYVDGAFEVPEDCWVRAAICRPDNRKVVHHIIVRVKYPAQAERASMEEVFFTSWAPGGSVQEYPSGTGKFLPKGARFNFELHYNTLGTEQTDRSELGIYLMKSAPKLTLETRATENRDFTIMPGEVEANSHALYCFKREAMLFDLAPHMHLRGSTFRYELLYPTGQREVLLSVPNYDFNWQTDYRPVEPKRVPAGTWLFCTGSHDNSPLNPRNPDPTKRVRWGLQSFEEMFMGFFTAADLPAKDGQSAAVVR